MQRVGHCRTTATLPLAALSSLALLAAAGCTAPVKPPPLPPSANGSSASPASYTLPDGTKVHDVKCSCCQH
jgi:hypothetical protein